jgi:hypothetical protein
MFWWGNHFSVTLHLQGEYFNRYKQMLVGNFAHLQGAGYYVCVHNTPWEYHYEFENYLPLANFSVADFQTELDQRSFTKLSRKLSLEAWVELPLFANETFSQLMTYLENDGAA